MHREFETARDARRWLAAGLVLVALSALGIALAAFAQTPTPTAATEPTPATEAAPPATTAPEATPAPEAAPATQATSPAPSPAERVAALKESLQRDQAALKQYEWLETTVMSMKGEEKSRKQTRCYHGADGKLHKEAVGDQPEPEKKKRGIRGKVVEGKKEEISSYMTQAAAAIKKYIPPDPARLQALQAAGKVSVQVLEPGKRARVDFKDYSVPGDVLGIEVDLTSNKILGLAVTTLIGGGKEPVNFQAKFASLPDGTGYPQTTMLDAKEMGVTINVENSAYKKLATQ